MTIHGSKGLEFPIVHLPGLNVNTLPRTSQRPACPPPNGMVEGREGNVQEAFRAEQQLEQECLFYVALSRARDRLFLYAPTQKSNGHKWGLSPFLDRLGSGLRRQHIIPDRVLPEKDFTVPLVVEGRFRFTVSQISQYDSCPRRFFFTHVLQLGGHRKETAFMQMHEVVRKVAQTLITEGTITSDADLEQQIWETMVDHELSDHSCAEEFKTIVMTMLRFFVEMRTGYIPKVPTTLSLTVGNEEITVRPDDVLISPDGKKTIRRIRTGRMRSSESKAIGTAAFVLAVQQAFPDASVEFLYLSEQQVQNVTLTPKELKSSGEKLVKFLDNIRSGQFPPEPSSRTCPSCPAFFICDLIPVGTLSRKF